MNRKSLFLRPDGERIDQFRRYLRPRGRTLDMGTGSGVLALLAQEMGASAVDAVDINPFAIEYARKILPENIKVFQSDLFAQVTGKYQTIIFAAPWSTGEIKDPLDYALFDNGVTRRFFLEVSTHLENDGEIWFQYCDAFQENFHTLDVILNSKDFNVINSWSYKTYGFLVNRLVSVFLFQIQTKKLSK